MCIYLSSTFKRIKRFQALIHRLLVKHENKVQLVRLENDSVAFCGKKANEATAGEDT